jgi:glutamate racemase
MEGSIGVFDSGVGGLAVLGQLHARAPELATIYAADRRHLPYGDHSPDFVAARAHAISRRLIGDGAAMVVVACNTASAAALDELRRSFPDTPFVGMEPAVKPAASLTTSGVIGVLGTAATLAGELMARVEARHANGTRVERRVGQGLAAAVEFGNEAEEEVRRLLADHVEAFAAAGVDTVVLGCTHYSFLAGRLASLTDGSMQIVDPSEAVARRCVQVAAENGLEPGMTRRYVTTADPAGVAARITALTGQRVEVRLVDW